MTSSEGGDMEATDAETPPGPVFPPQVPFSWTLRGARAQRLKSERAPRSISYRIAGAAREVDELAAAIAFCEEHNARLQLD
jgi:hypothetical protein